MAKNKGFDESIKEIKSRLQDEKVILGTDRVLKLIKSKKLSKIFLASNCPEKVKEDIKYYAHLAEIPIILLDLNNEELGVTCRKNYYVSVLGITK